MLDKKIFLIIFLVFLLFPVLSQGAGLVPCGGTDEPACQLCHLFVMLDRILDFIILILAPIAATLMLVVGGIVFFFAGAKPETLNTAKDIIFNTLLGLAIIFTAWLLINTFFDFIGVADWTGLRTGWWAIICPI